MTPKKIRVDIDSTICFTPCIGGKNMYEQSIPLTNRIKVINALYNAGHHIIYYTARGASSGINHEELTRSQLSEWCCLYHALDMSKPSFDILIDDKAITSLSASRAVEMGLIDIS